MSGRFQFSQPKQISSESCRTSRVSMKEKEEALPLLEVTKLIFDLISFKDLKRLSVVEVTSKEGVNGLFDPAMGTTNEDQKCSTCYRNVDSCPGHYGHIILAEPIPHPLYIRIIIQILNSVCNQCAGLILSNKDIEDAGILQYTGLTRLALIEERSIGKLCHRAVKKETQCARNVNYIPKESQEYGIIAYYLDDKKDIKRRKTAHILRLFEKVSERDGRTLGFGLSSPVDTIMQALVVLPPKTRPVELIDDNYIPNPLTVHYADIIKFNEILKAAKSSAKKDVAVYDQNLDRLIWHIRHFIDNSDKEAKRNSKTLNGIRQELGGKEGTIRRNIQGKRVDFAGRTVLGPNPDLKFGQISLPKSWRDVLTPSDRVNRYNIEALTEAMRRGEIVRMYRGSGKNKDLPIRITEEKRGLIVLQYGDMVDRFLRDGDYVAFNRQPTLHKESFMGFEVVLWDRETIGLHVSYTTPTNADFDGDEGNVHIPRSYETQAEMREILNVKRCILSSEDNATSLGVVYDVVLGLTLLTLHNPTIDKGIFNDCILKLTNVQSLPSLQIRLAKYGVHPYSGRALFSSLFPEDFYYSKHTKSTVVIREGILISGYITKPDVGTARNSIIQILAKKYGDERASDFLTDSSFVVNAWLTEYGFSVGYSDLSIIEKGENICERLSLEEYGRIKVIVDALHMKFDNPIERAKAERDVVAQLGTIVQFGDRLVREKLPLDNRLGLMVEASSKGSTFNIAQIVTLLGQQTIKGQRPKPTIRRGAGEVSEMVCTTYDVEPDIESRGFCKSSFKKGLNPREYFLHLLTGREGLLDTASQVAKIGALNHRNARALEDMKAEQDGTVRNSKGRIYQIMYGEDGFSPAQLQVTKGFNGEDVATFIDIPTTVDSINAQFGFSSNF